MTKEFFAGVMMALDIAAEEMAKSVAPKKVIFNNPATIVYWQDDTKTVVKCQNGEPFDKEKGFAMAFMKKFFGNTGKYNEVLKKCCPEDE